MPRPTLTSEDVIFTHNPDDDGGADFNDDLNDEPAILQEQLAIGKVGPSHQLWVTNSQV